MKLRPWPLSDRALLALTLILLVIPTTALFGLLAWQQEALWTYSTYGSADSIAMSSNGSYVVVGLLNDGPRTGLVTLLDKTGKLQWTYNANAAINSVAITPDGSYIAAAGYRIISTTNPNTVQVNGTVYYLNHKGQQLWNYTSEASGLPGDSGLPSLGVRLSPDGSRVVVDNGIGVLVLNGNGQLLWSYRSRGDPSVVLASADQSIIGVIDGQIHAFNAQGSSIWNSTFLARYIEGASISSDGKYIAVEGHSFDSSQLNSTLYLFDNQGTRVWSRTIYGGSRTLLFSPDDSRITFAENGATTALDLQNRRLWNDTSGAVISLAASSVGHYLVEGLYSTDQQTLRVLDDQGGIGWGAGPAGPAGWVYQIVVSSDDSCFAVAIGPSNAVYSANSASASLYSGPKTLVSEKGPTYSFLYLDHNTGTLPPILALPAALCAIPLVILAVRKLRTSRRRDESRQQPPGPKDPNTA